MRSRFRCRPLPSSTPCSLPLASDVSECCLVARQGQLTCTFQYLWTKNMHRCLRDKKNRKLKVLAEIVLWESPPGANVLPTLSASPGQRNKLLCGLLLLFWCGCWSFHQCWPCFGLNRLLVFRSLQTRATWKILMWRPWCEEHCLQTFWHPSSWFLETADCKTSHEFC